MNQGYPPMATVYLRHPPVLLEPDGSRPCDPLRLDPRVLAAARWLGERADFLVVISNTPHLFADEIAAAAGRPLLSMIDVTVAELKRRNPRGPVGLAGLGIPQVYAERFEQEGYEPLVPPQQQREALDRAILRVMEGGETDDDRALARRVVVGLRAAGAAVTVLGCTEIPLLLGDAADRTPDWIHPAELLAEAAVLRSLEAVG
jgi:aspartate racemase